MAGYQPVLPEWKLGTPDFVVNIPEQSVAAEGVFDYRYVTVDVPNTDDVWLRATEIIPGNTRVLHHIIATTIRPGEDHNTKGKSLSGYAPGMGPDLLPEGETQIGSYLGIRPKDIENVQNGMVMPGPSTRSR